MQRSQDSSVRFLDGPPSVGAAAIDCVITRYGVDAAVIAVAGELDIATSPSLAEELSALQSDCRVVVLDLRQITFIDSSGVQLTLAAHKRASETGTRFVVLRGAPPVDQLFTLTGLCGLLEDVTLDPREPAEPVLLGHIVGLDHETPWRESRVGRGDPSVSDEAAR